jgi:hypothetical protein
MAQALENEKLLIKAYSVKCKPVPTLNIHDHDYEHSSKVSKFKLIVVD